MIKAIKKANTDQDIHDLISSAARKPVDININRVMMAIASDVLKSPGMMRAFIVRTIKAVKKAVKAHVTAMVRAQGATPFIKMILSNFRAMRGSDILDIVLRKLAAFMTMLTCCLMDWTLRTWAFIVGHSRFSVRLRSLPEGSMISSSAKMDLKEGGGHIPTPSLRRLTFRS
ncbi:hypothetical protein [Candidatus Methanocrinis natronophilus]|uniref:Uncharacterized protein n=1 Tax=Candidatus Methanocrinis natronophilus TaxID=3033396 RepID=A0ABT5XA91_9EURY|nr:hypothetical protein [Candidatus Methanocrinis natronophilus]MDF0591614.1 hypothetical protein [Candidatus Methanocrinis natronophilus]